MLIRLYRPQTNQYEIRLVTRQQLEEVFKTNTWLEKVDVLKISRVITRARGLK